MTDRNRFLLIFVLLLTAGLWLGASENIEIKCMPTEITAFQGEKVVLTVEVTNGTRRSLRPEKNFFFSYHLYDRKGKLVSYDNRRFKIPRVLRRGKKTSFDLPMFFEYKTAGRYLVVFDIVKEGEYWGSGKGWKTCQALLDLKPLFSDEFKEKYFFDKIDTGNPLLDKEHHVLRMTFKNCEIKKDGKLFGFAAGSAYPQVWIRDIATSMNYAKRHYPTALLAEMVERFMVHQGVDGEVVDWVDVSGKTDKNTVETDQESSLVLAACEIAADKPAWLGKTVKGKTVLERLDMALDWVWKHRRDTKWNLLTSGFTADWGDIENTFPDERANKLSEGSTLVFGIYTQAKYIQALDALTAAAKQRRQSRWAVKMKTWAQRRNLLAKQSRKHLYLNDEGYYIAHMVPGADKYSAMEKKMLPVGGNAEAMIAGLMDKGQVKRFLEVLEQRRKTYKLRTVSFTLIPPYPEGFFKHHLMRRPWSYQNGGEWDWIGGRVVKALYMTGFTKEADTYLMEIVRKHLAAFSINEWEDRGGTMQGAHFYVGAAGVMGEAMEKRAGVER